MIPGDEVAEGLLEPEADGQTERAGEDGERGQVDSDEIDADEEGGDQDGDAASFWPSSCWVASRPVARRIEWPTTRLRSFTTA